MSMIIKNILRCIALVTLFFLGCVAGILVEQNNQKRLENVKALEEHMKIRDYINLHPEYYKCPTE